MNTETSDTAIISIIFLKFHGEIVVTKTICMTANTVVNQNVTYTTPTRSSTYIMQFKQSIQLFSYHKVPSLLATVI